MFTYDFTDIKKPLYQHLYDCIKSDILASVLKSGEKLPSKRALAENLKLSVVTVENAYTQLADEGYIYSEPKKGFYVAEIIRPEISTSEERAASGATTTAGQGAAAQNSASSQNASGLFNFSSNVSPEETFPFSIWARLMRESITKRKEDALLNVTCSGLKELRCAIAGHLSSFRGMTVNPEQIIVGAGTEYLYGLLIQLLGRDKIFCLENPGYRKIANVYESNGVKFVFCNLDEKGIKVDEISRTGADIIHTSPTHHFPTGITMSADRRYELLRWAGQKDGRFIIEDDYDSEFRLNGRPIPSLQSLDNSGRVIYMNTFSKSLAHTIRISYMVLPPALAKEFYERLSFYTCTVSNFEQYTLARFISEGYFEKHINRMRLFYGRKRKTVLDLIAKVFNPSDYRIIENDSGLHFILYLNTKKTDDEFVADLKKHDIQITPLVSFYSERDGLENSIYEHKFIVNYSNIDIFLLEKKLQIVKKVLSY
ncbi:MAG: PLP-dependent aminotransferase family protein [Treponemataceae bacterium]|nr:PLP-dependent aminotransferase family protein [Treponemataceae bacterium]